MSEVVLRTSQNNRLSGFQVIALVIAILATLVSLAGAAWTYADRKDDQEHLAAMPATVRSVVEQSTVTDPAVADTDTETWTHWGSTHGMKIGLAFLGGFALGFAFRAFIKTMVVLTLFIVVAILLLSYFNVVNVDLTRVQNEWNSNSEWITTQAIKAKDFLWAYLASSLTVVVGAIVGVMRR